MNKISLEDIYNLSDSYIRDILNINNLNMENYNSDRYNVSVLFYKIDMIIPSEKKILENKNFRKYYLYDNDYLNKLINNASILAKNRIEAISKLLNYEDEMKLVEENNIVSPIYYSEKLSNINGLNINFSNGWLFFSSNYSYEIDEIDENQPFIKTYVNEKNMNIKDRSKLWKLFITTNNKTFEYVIFKIIHNFIKRNVEFYGKIPLIYGKNFETCLKPRIVFYVESIKNLREHIMIIENLFSKEIEKYFCNTSKENLKIDILGDTFENIQNGPSFTKEYNKIIFYGQSGYNESGRSKLVDMSNNLIPKEISKIKNKEISKKYKYNILKSILDLEFDGKNNFKYKGYIDPLENRNITMTRNYIYDKIINEKDVINVFYSLQFTHNTSIDVLKQISNHGYIKGEHGRGAQFRYGLDSQYGIVMIIMKKNDYLLKMYSDRTDKNDIIVKGMGANKQLEQEPYFTSLSDGLDRYKNEEIDDKLNQDAINYTFRKYQNNHIFCNNKIIMNDGHYINSNSKSKMSWCNTQLHIGSNVSTEHIDYILVPGFIYDQVKDINENLTIDGNINYLYNKIIKIDVDQNNINCLDKYTRVECMQKGVFRNDMMGNSSKIGINMEEFTKYESEYMKILLYNNCFLASSKYNYNDIINKLKINQK